MKNMFLSKGDPFGNNKNKEKNKITTAPFCMCLMIFILWRESQETINGAADFF